MLHLNIGPIIDKYKYVRFCSLIFGLIKYVLLQTDFLFCFMAPCGFFPAACGVDFPPLGAGTGPSDPPSINRSLRRSFSLAFKIWICSSMTVSRFLSRNPCDSYSTLSAKCFTMNAERKAVLKLVKEV